MKRILGDTGHDPKHGLRLLKLVAQVDTLCEEGSRRDPSIWDHRRGYIYLKGKQEVDWYTS